MKRKEEENYTRHQFIFVSRIMTSVCGWTVCERWVHS